MATKRDAFAEGTMASFTREENDLLTQTGPGTPMGELFRQYWIPVVPSSHIAEPGGKPLRIRLLSEDLVAFRTSDGTAGVVGAFCPHRLAPLFFGRIEEDGIRCPYHGWKFAPDGACLDMPNVPERNQFKEQIKHLSYPCVENGGVVWIYMGSADEVPALPDFEFTRVPDELRTFGLFHHDCNYLQALEGGIDPTHVMWLHSPYDLGDEEMAAKHLPVNFQFATATGHRTPDAVEIVDTEGGFMYGARRPKGNGRSQWRINQFIMPFYTMPASGDLHGGRMWVPIDDEHSVKWMFRWFSSQEIKETTTDRGRDIPDDETYIPMTNQPYGHIITKARKENDYLIDWETTKTRRLGIAGVNLQDKAIQENEGPGPILDRTKEILCAGDVTTAKARRMLTQAALALKEKGTIPVGVGDGGIYRVRGISAEVSDDIEWVESLKEQLTVPPQAA